MPVPRLPTVKLDDLDSQDAADFPALKKMLGARTPGSANGENK